MPSPPASIMVCTGVLTGLLLFSLFSSVVSADKVNPDTLPKIIQVFETRYKPELTDKRKDLQYSVAINVPAEQCTGNFIEKDFLNSEDTDNNIKNNLNDKNKRLYIGTEMVAARPKFSAGSPAIHSERALLMCEDNNHADTPMKRLLSKGDGNDCVVFYTYNSPCLDYCLNQTNVETCILNSLSILTNHPGPKAFVYSQVYGKGREKPELDSEKTKLASALKEVAEKVPLYKCNTNSCIECLDNNNNFNNECLS